MKKITFFEALDIIGWEYEEAIEYFFEAVEDGRCVTKDELPADEFWDRWNKFCEATYETKEEVKEEKRIKTKKELIEATNCGWKENMISLDEVEEEGKIRKIYTVYVKEEGETEYVKHFFDAVTLAYEGYKF